MIKKINNNMDFKNFDQSMKKRYGDRKFYRPSTKKDEPLESDFLKELKEAVETLKKLR